MIAPVFFFHLLIAKTIREENHISILAPMKLYLFINISSVLYNIRSAIQYLKLIILVEQARQSANLALISYNYRDVQLCV